MKDAVNAFFAFSVVAKFFSFQRKEKTSYLQKIDWLTTNFLKVQIDAG